MMRPQLRSLHAGQREPRGVERRAQVDRDDRVPLLDREVLDRRHVLDAGVVDQDVDAAELALGVAPSWPRSRPACSCRRRGSRPCTPSCRHLAPSRHRRRRSRSARSSAPCARQCLGDAEADAAGRAGDERGLSFQHDIRSGAACYDAIIDSRPQADHDRRLASASCSASTRAACTAWRTGSGATPPTRACWSACTGCRARAAISTRWRARCARDVPRGLPRRRRAAAESDWLADPLRLRDPDLRGRHGHAAGAAGRRRGRLGRHVDGRADRPGAGVACRARRCAAWCSTTSARRSSARRSRASAATSASRCVGATLDEAADYLWTISQGFGPHTREQWLALTRADGASARRRRLQAALRPGRSPCRSAPSRREIAAAGEAVLWQAYDALRCPTLLLRGAESDLLSHATRPQAMTAARAARRGCIEFAGVGHAPTLVQPSRSTSCATSCCRHEDRRAASAATPRRRSSCSSPIARSAPHAEPTRSRRSSMRRPSARAPSPSRCSPAARSTPARTRSRMPTAWRRSCRRIGAAPSMRAAAYLVYAGDYLQRARGGGRARPSATSYASLVGAHAQAGADAARRARARSVGRRQRARSRPSACARCCSRSRATCASCCCGWRRGCRRCAGTRRASRPCPTALARESHAGVRAAGQPAGHLADQVGARGPGVPLPRSPSDYQQIARLLDEKRVEREQRRRSGRAASSTPLLRRTGMRAEVQGRPKHLYSIWKKMQGKGLALRPACSTCARCASIVDDVAALLCGAGRVHERWPRGGRRVRRLHRAAQAQRLPVAAHRGARRRRPRRSRCRSAPARCTSTPSTASPRTGPTRRPARRAMPASAPPATSRTASPRRARRCCASCWPGSATSPSRARPATRGAVRRPHLRLHAAGHRSSSCRAGATPIDFAYALHTDLGHRCRGAQGRRRDGAAEHAAGERPDGRGRRREGGRPVARLAQRRARLPGQRALAGQGARLVQRAGAAGRRSRAAASWSRSCCSAKAARRSSSTTSRRSSASATPTRCSRSSARTSTRCATSKRCCARPSRCRRRTRRSRCAARAPTAAPRRRAGRRRRVAADHAGALLPAGAARRRSAAS